MGSRGFITVATGDKFYKLAKNLVLSYRKFGRGTYPFGVITDERGGGNT